MRTAQARRTLVKSPPELWAELSDAETLGRRLQPFGEIRITRVEPETSLTWEAERVRGTVEIEPSGWGTRVTLTAESSEPPAPAPAPAAPEPEPSPIPTPVATSITEELPQTTAALGQGYEASLPMDPRPVAFPLDPGGFVSRLFGIRRRPRAWAPWAEAPVAHAPTVEPRPIPLPDPPVAPLPDRPEPVPAAPVQPEAPEDPLPAPDPGPPLEPAADLDEVLTGVLDDLGAAHHRPFSRG